MDVGIPIRLHFSLRRAVWNNWKGGRRPPAAALPPPYDGIFESFGSAFRWITGPSRFDGWFLRMHLFSCQADHFTKTTDVGACGPQALLHSPHNVKILIQAASSCELWPPSKRSQRNMKVV